MTPLLNLYFLFYNVCLFHVFNIEVPLGFCIIYICINVLFLYNLFIYSWKKKIPIIEFPSLVCLWSFFKLKSILNQWSNFEFYIQNILLPLFCVITICVCFGSCVIFSNYLPLNMCLTYVFSSSHTFFDCNMRDFLQRNTLNSIFFWTY